MPVFAKIDTAFPDDPKVIDAGDIAELVYLRCVLRSKHYLTDGIIDRRVLARWLAGIRGKPATHMARLVEVGLVVEHDDGWAIPDHAWRRWNSTAEEVEQTRQDKADGGAKGNHERWHVARQKFVASCQFCVASPSHPDRITDRLSSPEVETETEGETDLGQPTPSPDGDGPQLVLVGPVVGEVLRGRAQDQHRDLLFDAWWGMYPRKVAKAEARRAFGKATTRATIEQLTAGLARAITAWDAEQRSPEKIPHAATWLNGDRWHDEHRAPVAPGAQGALAKFREQAEAAVARHPAARGLPTGGPT